MQGSVFLLPNTVRLGHTIKQTAFNQIPDLRAQVVLQGCLALEGWRGGDIPQAAHCDLFTRSSSAAIRQPDQGQKAEL